MAKKKNKRVDNTATGFFRRSNAAAKKAQSAERKFAGSPAFRAKKV